MEEDTPYVKVDPSVSRDPAVEMVWIRQQAIYEILRSPNVGVQNVHNLIEAADKIADFIVNGARRGDS